jgi:hypothetical protein
MTSKGLLVLIALIGFSAVSNAQKSVEPAKAPAVTAPATKDVPVPADSEVAILKAQRSVQSAQIQEADRRQKAVDAEQKAEQQADANLKQAITELNAAVEKARNELKLPANAPFDQMKLAFTVPAK